MCVVPRGCSSRVERVGVGVRVRGLAMVEISQTERQTDRQTDTDRQTAAEVEADEADEAEAKAEAAGPS